MKLFKKLKDYNNLLEDILDKKTFSSVAKSLLLSMIYKLEIAYKDYSEVNVNCITKEKFLDNILFVIKNYCDHIKIVEPESSQATLLVEHNVDAVTNTKERSILSYSTEQAMLYAITDIEPKYFYMKNDFVFKKTFQKLLVKAYEQSTTQILKNFNGWSWDINVSEKQEYIPNVIYYNILVIKGEDFLYKWRTDNQGKEDYLLNLKRLLKKITGNDNYYLSLCKILYKVANPNDKRMIKKELEHKEKIYREYFAQTDEFRKENIKEFNKLKKYHDILSNEKTQYEELVQLQKYFLKYIDKKIQKATLQEEIIEIIYQLRYYQNLIFFEGVLIKDYAPIKKSLDSTLKQAFTKACKMGVIKIISMDIETNFEILKYILDTKIIDLEEIKIYDKEIFEKQGKIKLKSSKKDIAIKKKKMVKLFNN